MGYKLTPEERRIIRKTEREGEEMYGAESPAERRKRTWKGAIVWMVVIFLFVISAAFIYYIGTFL